MTEQHKQSILPSSKTNDQSHTLSRRSFVQSGAGFSAALYGISALGAEAERKTVWEEDSWNPNAQFVNYGKPLRVQPILMYTVATPRKERSWRSWGDVLSDESAAKEADRIDKELYSLSEKAEFPLEILPVQKVKTTEDAERARQSDHDIVIVYPASGSGQLLQACTPPDGNAIIFARHRSGATYYWYEGLSTVYLQTEKDTPGARTTRLGKTHVDDIVVDDCDELLWRLRALYGVKNFRGTKIVALGGVWGKYASEAPQLAREKFGMDLIEIGYGQVEDRIRGALKDSRKMALAKQWTETYLSIPKTTIKTDQQFIVNAFLLYGLFKELMAENGATAFTIKDCMSVVIPISKTTACLTLGLLNDEGLLAFCESDFVIIPAGILLRHITGTPVFLHNSTFPHNGIVTCAHCSAPRRMNADRYEPTTIYTHEESDYGAAPKVDIPIGQEVTFIDPEYATGRWIGFRGNVEDNPFLPICRSQQDVRIQGQWKKLLSEVRDSHWMMVYGDYLKEVGYAARKLGMRWENISDV